jgi:hypothetical protein
MDIKNRTQILIFLTICIIFISISLYGCIKEEKNEPDEFEPNYPRNRWSVEITRIPQGRYSISENLTFEIQKDNKLIISTNISMVNPKPFLKAMSTVYPISSNSSPVVDESTGKIINGDSSSSEYKNCCFAYIDQTSDNNINGGDLVYIYQDWNRDGEADVTSGSMFKIFDQNNEIILQKELL